MFRFRSKRPKYGNVKTVIGGIKFDSKAEAARYGELLALQQAAKIGEIERQVRYRLDVNGEHICNYIADFRYATTEGVLVVEDVKGVRTRDYIIKRKLMKAVHGVVITEIGGTRKKKRKGLLGVLEHGGSRK